MNEESGSRALLRAALRARRSALTASQRIIAAQALVTSLERIPQFLTDRRIAGYWAIGGELPLAALIQGLRERDQAYHLPIVGAKRQLTFAPWRPGAEIAMSRHGIPEPVVTTDDLRAPVDMDVVLLPLLGFDRRGYRLGAGGGYYDRSFDFLCGRDAPGRPLLVGIAFAMQELAAIEAMPWDVRLDYVATEDELIDCTPVAS